MSNLDLTIIEIMHGDTPTLRVMHGDIRVWPSGTDIIIDGSLTNVACSVNLPSTAPLGEPLTLVLTPSASHVITNVAVSMGSEDITSTAYNEGVITIANVTGDILISASATEVITFEDAAVKAICVANWGGGTVAGEITPAEARAVTTLGNKFEQNTDIVKFNELRYFTGLTTLSRSVSGQYLDGMTHFGAFNRCSNLEEVTLPTITMAGGNGGNRVAALFCQCSKLKSIDMSPITITGTSPIDNICGKCSALVSAILPTITPHTSYLAAIYAFNKCSNIVTIDASRVNFANMNYTNNANIFASCTKLTRIIGGLPGFRQTEESIKVAPLTHDAAVELLTSLGTVAAARTLKLKTSVYNSLTAEEKAIATGKGWTLSYG